MSEKAPNPTAAAAKRQTRGEQAEKDLVAGVAFSCILAVLCGLAITKPTTNVDTGILRWIVFAVLSGAGIVLPARMSAKRVWKIGLPYASVLLLTLYFKLLVSILFAAQSYVSDLKGGRVEYVTVGIGSLGLRLFPVGSAETVEGAEFKVPEGIPVLDSSPGIAFLKVFILYGFIALFSVGAVSVCALARKRIVAVATAFWHMKAADVTKLEKVVTSVYRVVSIMGGAAAAWLL